MKSLKALIAATALLVVAALPATSLAQRRHAPPRGRGIVRRVPVRHYVPTRRYTPVRRSTFRRSYRPNRFSNYRRRNVVSRPRWRPVRRSYNRGVRVRNRAHYARHRR